MSKEQEKGTDDRTCVACGEPLRPHKEFICQFIYLDETDPFATHAFGEFCCYDHLVRFVSKNGPGESR